MSDDRTREPSRRRRDQARQRGQVARSPELTAAVGLLAALLLIGAWGDDLASALVRLIREPLEAADLAAAWTVADAPAALVEHLRAAAWATVWPLGVILGGTALAMLAAHQIQTRGLWAPALLAPDPQRLWSGWGSGEGFVARLLRGVGGLLRSIAVVAVATWAIRGAWPSLAALSSLETPGLALAAAGLLRSFAHAIGLTLLVLGLLDFVGQYRRLEARLRLSPDQEREELKAADGDPELRARRARLARSRLHEPREALSGAALVVTGPDGLAILLGGSPPPGRVNVQLVARGSTAATIRRAAPAHGLPLAEAPALAHWFAQARSAGPGAPLPAELAAELATIWPGQRAEASRNPGKDPAAAGSTQAPQPPMLAS